MTRKDIDAMDNDEFWEYITEDSDDSDKTSRTEIVPTKKKSAISSGLIKTKDGVMAHPLHSVFPRDSKIGKTISWWAAGVYTFRVGKKCYEWVNEKVDEANRDKYSISIESYDEENLYSLVFGWIMGQMDSDEPITDYNLMTIYKRPKHIVTRASNTNSSFDMELLGIPTQIALDEKETKEGNVMSLKKNLVIRCADQPSLDTISEFIAEMYDDFMYEKVKEEVDSGRYPRPYALWTGNTWQWKELLPRDIESVILAGTDREDLFADIDRFRDLKVEYLRTNIPWHRGYLFYGPPGTGKTSLGLAVASQYDLPVYFLPLSSVLDDSALIKAVGSLDAREAVLILEDIDVIEATHSRNVVDAKSDGKSDGKSLTLNGLLNVLDGINSPSGLITVMTTNHLDTLDSALIRPGRVDLKFQIGFLDDDQLRRLVLWYISIDIKDFPKIESDITPADITGIVKDYMLDSEGCVEVIRQFILESNEATK